MRRRLILVVTIAVVALALTALAVTRGGGGSDDSTPAAFPAQKLSAGQIDITLQPDHVDGTGAEVKVTLDTHAGDLDMDLLTGATLEVGGVRWPAVAWEGDGPGGHHREGRLRFESAGPERGPIELRLDGFDGPVVATWGAGS